MNPQLSSLVADARVAELRETAGRRRVLGPQVSVTPREQGGLTLRAARQDDTVALVALAELDSSEPLLHPVLVAEVDGRLACAVSLADRRVIADPFQHTTELIALLEFRARQLPAGGRRSLREVLARPARALRRGSAPSGVTNGGG